MTDSPELPLVSIGIPTYNRPEGLRRTLACLTEQTYENLEIVISDNCSPDARVQEIAREFANKDSRIKYFRQEENQGPTLNFKFVLAQAIGPYFMWASDDDEWEPEFIQVGIETLQNKPGFDAWFCSIDLIDSFSRPVLTYPDFLRFTSTGDKRKDIIRYIKDPGGMGKPNFVYSLYKKESLEKTAQEYFFSLDWGADTAFNLAFQGRYNIITTDRILFHKRVTRRSVEDKKDKITPIEINLKRSTYHPKRFVHFTREYCKALTTTPYKKTVVTTMTLRLPIVITNYLITRINRKKESILKRLRKIK